MGAIINFSVNLDKLDKSRIIKGKSGNYLNLTLSVNDEVSQYGDNASIFISQTKEERDAKAQRTYVGNGKVAWTDGNIQAIQREAVAEAAPAQEDGLDLPF
jgi:hypothetical protein